MCLKNDSYSTTSTLFFHESSVAIFRLGDAIFMKLLGLSAALIKVVARFQLLQCIGYLNVGLYLFLYN